MTEEKEEEEEEEEEGLFKADAGGGGGGSKCIHSYRRERGGLRARPRYPGVGKRGGRALCAPRPPFPRKVCRELPSCVEVYTALALTPT